MNKMVVEALQGILAVALLAATGYFVNQALSKRKQDAIERVSLTLFYAVLAPAALLTAANLFIGIPFNFLSVVVILAAFCALAYWLSVRKAKH